MKKEMLAAWKLHVFSMLHDLCCNRERRQVVAKSVLEAIQAGDWDFEPKRATEREFRATDALPGSPEKLEILARRIRDGLPLWHPNDRHTFDGTLLAE